ncbi:MAG: metalloenzyme [Ignavibacteriae bacterium]|nr:metalloenzyme [Ignavibacteriota bacterium]
MQSTILIFLDGVGIGKSDPKSNPFFKYNFKTFTKLFNSVPHLDNQKLSVNNRYIFPTDAVMGTPKLPQSGTGQTSIFCGVNASKIMERHFGPYPHSKLLPIIREENIFKKFMDRKKKVVFVNAYPKEFFDYIKDGSKRMSVTSLSCRYSNVPLKKKIDLSKGNALSAEIDNSRWVNNLKYKLRIIKPETAAKRLIKIASQHHFTLFEHFHTDFLGHGRESETLEERLKILDRFLLYLFENLPKKINILVCSDHGNLENISIKSHTNNPALTMSAGKNAKYFAERIKNISQIRDAILNLY